VRRGGEGRRPWAVMGSLVFLVLVPGTVAGWVPFRLTGWQMRGPMLGSSVVRVVGAGLIVAGALSLLESFGRFASVGLGTPAPVAPPTALVVSGQYRYVRNPMYVAVLGCTLGQGLLLGSAVLLEYAAALWLLFHLFVVLYEEPTLEAKFGEPYGAYRQRVRRWLPRVKA